MKVIYDLAVGVITNLLSPSIGEKLTEIFKYIFL